MSVEVKVGDKIDADRFWVSEMNMRHDLPFGESEEDQALIGHFRRTKVVQPFKARPENDGYGVYVGRRRFLAMRKAGYKEFVMGVHVWIEELSDEEAREASLKENLEVFQKTPDPVTRGEAINAYLSRLPTGIRGLAGAWNIPRTTLQDYLKILELSPGMREAVRRGLVGFHDGLLMVRLKLGQEAQDKMAELAESSGLEAFKHELARLMAGKGKRGIPRGVYFILRVPWDKRSQGDQELYAELGKLAEKAGLKLEQYAKKVLTDHIKSQA